MYVTSMSDTVSLMNSCKEEHRKGGSQGWTLPTCPNRLQPHKLSPTLLNSSLGPSDSWWQCGDGAEQGPLALENA